MWPVEEIPECDSTQTWALRMISADPRRSAFVVYTLGQRQGVGRQGHAWLHCGHALAVSLCWPSPSPGVGTAWPAWVSLMVVEALEALFPATAGSLQLKWPNDLVVAEKKLGGVLVHQKIVEKRPWLVAGVGINLRWQTPAPPGMAVTDLASLITVLPDPAWLVRAITDRLAQAVAEPQPVAWSARFNAKDVYRGHSVVVRGPAIAPSGVTGCHVGIDALGRIGIQTATGLAHFGLGEVSLRGYSDT
ncbi:MAG: hypothetical protein RL258_770 [Pseudomonadota bacterium]